MRAKTIHFERGSDPKKSMSIGSHQYNIPDLIKRILSDAQRSSLKIKPNENFTAIIVEINYQFSPWNDENHKWGIYHIDRDFYIDYVIIFDFIEEKVKYELTAHQRQIKEWNYKVSEEWDFEITDDEKYFINQLYMIQEGNGFLEIMDSAWDHVINYCDYDDFEYEDEE